jgi:hypothetical protein
MVTWLLTTSYRFFRQLKVHCRNGPEKTQCFLSEISICENDGIRRPTADSQASLRAPTTQRSWKQMQNSAAPTSDAPLPNQRVGEQTDIFFRG